MSLELVVFAIASGLAIVSALAMVVVKTPVRSVVSLLVTFFALAVLFVLLAAPFIAAIQVIVYAGAILVLFLFVVMLLNLTQEAEGHDERPIQRLLGLVSVV
ncbi:MAG TPA: NADH-quinone oxidoreductase subunit J, partial [Thermoanaerobaculia bacterium]|nr:NADH-quinone oxidoreductase subunit J [Thermoanaerobaculia bacterium]